jgi:hypothetical protein
LRFLVVVRQRNRNGSERPNLVGGAVRDALTISRAVAGSGATQIVRLYFLNVGFQHSNWTLCNRDANLPWIHLWILNDRKNPNENRRIKNFLICRSDSGGNAEPTFA